jgi:hypothetical protein
MNPSPYDVLSLVGSYEKSEAAIEEMKINAPEDFREWCRLLDVHGMRYCVPLSFKGYLRLAS